MEFIDNLIKKHTPLGPVLNALETGSKKVDESMTSKSATPKVEDKTPQQKAYEANEKFMNRNNPGYVPRAKGGRVKDGGCPMKNVDNSGFSKESVRGK